MLRSIIILTIGVALTMYFSTCAVIFAYLSPGENKVHKVANLWAKLMLLISHVQVRVIGRENVSAETPQIFMANHLSDFDIFVVLACIPGQFRWIAKKELYRIPVFGKAIRSAGYIAIDRQNHEKALRSVEEAAEKIRAGKSVMSFPEGTRSRDGKIKPFKQGMFHLALQAGVPIIPISIVGTHDIMPKRSLQINPSRVTMVIGKPIDVRDYTVETRHALIERVRQVIMDNYDAYRPSTRSTGEST